MLHHAEHPDPQSDAQRMDALERDNEWQRARADFHQEQNVSLKEELFEATNVAKHHRAWAFIFAATNVMLCVYILCR
jgi:hypothetical protein